uniref:Uncharacterized protein n=1 Tax=Romanomermis culicivorax TaxID=13658 RepID=A0A915JBW0_ROMCU
MSSATVVTTDKSWEEPEKTRESGTPPPPHATGVGIHISRQSHIEPEYKDVPDYRLEREKQSYNLRIIDPKDETIRRPKQRKMKQRVLREFEQEKYTEDERKVQAAPLRNVVETTECIEECKKTEEVERRVKSSKNDATKHQRSRSSNGERFIDDGFGGNRKIVDKNGFRQQKITNSNLDADSDSNLDSDLHSNSDSDLDADLDSNLDSDS